MASLSLDYFRQKKGYLVSRQWMEALCKFLIHELCHAGGIYTISVALVDEAHIKELNRLYRDHDEVTDILSFEASTDFIQTEDAFLNLGELVICVPYIQEQAQRMKRPWRFELQHLCIHGFLHLVGYDHGTKQGRRVMERLEEQLLQRRYSRYVKYSTLHPHERKV